MGDGIEVRETINQGFVRAEIGSGADDKARRVYNGAEISPTLLETSATSAIENYMAAIGCYLRAVRELHDERSGKLMREEIDRLLKRLEEMRALAKEAERLKQLNGGNPVKLSADQRLDFSEVDISDQDLMAQLEAVIGGDSDDDDQVDPNKQEWAPSFHVGSDVDVLQADDSTWRAATVTGVDPSNQTYTVLYDDDSTLDSAIRPERLRQREADDSLATTELSMDKYEADRLEVVSEIIESERSYVSALHNLKIHYIDPLTKPAHWGGQKEESLFTMKTMSAGDVKRVFSNVGEIIEGNTAFLKKLESCVDKWTDEQGLADVFIEFFPAFEKYEMYVVRFDDGMHLLEQMRKERMGIRSAEAAAKAHRIETLPELVTLPRDRLYVYTKLVGNLLARTPPEHPSLSKIERVVKFFKNLERKIDYAKNRKQNQAIVRRVEKLFKPSINLVQDNRVYLCDGELHMMSSGKSKSRKVWLFNDIIVYGRPSWLAPGFYRHKGSVTVSRFGSAFDYGPFAFFIENTAKHRVVFLPPDDSIKSWWFNKLEDCPDAIRERSTEEVKAGALIRNQPDMAREPAVKPPPPPPPVVEEDGGLPAGWVELFDDANQKAYYYSEDQGTTQWERPS